MISRPNHRKIQGFTLVELLVASVLGIITIMVAGQVVVSQIESSQKINKRERLRSDWMNANQFIGSQTGHLRLAQYRLMGS